MRGDQRRAVLSDIYVQREHNAIAPEAHEPCLDGIRFGDCQAANDATRDAGIQPAFQRIPIADATPKLHGHCCLAGNLRNDVPVHLGSRARTIEVDDVQIRCREIRKRSCHGYRVIAVFGRLLEIPLVQADAFTVLQVDGRNDSHDDVSMKFLNNREPAVEDRSG